eukprot:jgi/Mesvir1/21456/Mv26566-RA.2
MEHESCTTSLEDDIRNANSSWSSEVGEEGKESADQRSSFNGGIEARVDTPLANPRLYEALQIFWKLYGERFGQVWKAMNQNVREELLQALTGCTMPRWRGDKDAGGPGQSRGIALLCPEMNLRDLADPDHGVAHVMKTVVETCLREHFYKDATYLRPLIGPYLKAPNENPDSFCVLCMPGKLYETVVLTGKAGDAERDIFRRMVRDGEAYESSVWELISTKQSYLFHLLASVADEFRTSIWGKKRNAVSSQRLYCPGCGVTFGGPVRPSTCAACHVAVYCSRECQKAQWKMHAPICLQIRMR